MLTRAQARATNQHVFVDDKWNDAYIQTKDEQIDMLHAQRVLKSWDDDEDSEAEAADSDHGNEAEEDEDRWISEDSDSDDDDDDEAAKKKAEADAQRRRRSAGGSVLAGGGLVENVLWTVMAATVAPVLLYGAAARVGFVSKRRSAKSWPLQSASLAGTLLKAYTNVLTIAILMGVVVWGVCGDIVFPLSSPLLRWRSLTRFARRVDTCATGFVDDWRDVLTPPAQLPLLLLARETQQLVVRTVLVLAVALLLTQFYRLWLKSVVLLSALVVASVRVGSYLRAEQRTAIDISSLDPTFAFANESIFIAIDGQNLEQGATVAWVPYWGVLQHLQAAECDKLFAQPLRNGGVRVAFDQLNEFVPCYAPRGDDDDFKCFEHLRLRVKDQRSVPGWSLHATESRSNDEL